MIGLPREVTQAFGIWQGDFMTLGGLLVVRSGSGGVEYMFRVRSEIYLLFLSRAQLLSDGIF